MIDAARRLLLDRQRAQKGSVLSAVLIMVAFLAILSGALATELSTNFLLSHDIVNRVASEATVNSGTELSLSQLQDTVTTPLFDGCPTLGSVTLNGLTALAAYSSCYPVIDRNSSQQLRGIASTSGQFLQDAVHASLTGVVDDYLAGDSNGNLVAIPTGLTSPAWSYPLGGESVGSPIAMLADVSAPSTVSYLVPVTNPPNGAAGGCSTYCVALLNGTGAARPSLTCFMVANGPVASQPAPGVAFRPDAYFGDQSGELYAYSAVQAASCDQEATRVIGNDLGAPAQVVGGPFVIGTTSPTRADEIYVVVAAGSQGYLVHYTYSLGAKSVPAFRFITRLPLPFVPAAAAFESSTATIAITSLNTGQVALAQIQAKFSTTLGAVRQLPASIGDAPHWDGSQIGVAAGSTLYVLDSSLNIVASSQAPAAINTTPAVDNGGDWFAGAANGSLYERPAIGGSAQMVLLAGNAGNLTSSPMAFQCPTGICVYAASSDGSVYFAGLDARDAVIDSCLGVCASSSIGLRAVVEVGAAGSPRAVHVQGWSYYSP